MRKPNCLLSLFLCVMLAWPCVAQNQNFSYGTASRVRSGPSLPAACSAEAGDVFTLNVAPFTIYRATQTSPCVWTAQASAALDTGLAIPNTNSRMVVANNFPGANLGAKIQAANTALGSNKGTILVFDGGALGSTRITIGQFHNLIFYPGTYTNTAQDGIFDLSSNVTVEGTGDNTIFNESTFDSSGITFLRPYTIFMTHNTAVQSATFESNVTVRNLQIDGATPAYNSGPQAIALANCHNCTVDNVYIKGVKSIGVQLGGINGAVGHVAQVYAENSKIINSRFESVAAQDIAITNCHYCTVSGNVIIKPGQTAQFAPGTTPIDIEPNVDDSVRDVEVDYNTIDAREEAADFSTGSSSVNQGLQVNCSNTADCFNISITNNKIIGQRPGPGYGGTYGALIRTAKNVLFKNNSIAYFQTCLEVDYSSDTGIVAGNEMLSCGYTTRNSVEIDGATHFNFVNNRVMIDPLSAFAGSEDTSISETNATGTPANNLFVLNDADVFLTAASSKKYSNTSSTGILTVAGLLPDAAGTRSLGNTSFPWLGLYLGDSGATRTRLYSTATTPRQIALPDASGTVALTSDLPPAGPAFGSPSSDNYLQRRVSGNLVDSRAFDNGSAYNITDGAGHNIFELFGNGSFNAGDITGQDTGKYLEFDEGAPQFTFHGAAEFLTGLNSESTELNNTTIFNGGINPQGSGLKHIRLTTGSISGASTSLVTITWGTPFADANYTPTCSVIDSTTSSLSLSVQHIESKSASAITVRVLNNAATALTGELQCIAIHD